MKWWEARCIFLSVVVDLNDISRMKDKIESSKQSVIKLKRHMENGTCRPDLRYDAKGNIFPGAPNVNYTTLEDPMARATFQKVKQ